MLKDQMAANNLLFPANASTSASLTSNLPNIDSNSNAANQLALLQSFTSEMTIPTQAQLFQHHQQQQQQQQQPLANIKSEINNNGSGSEHMEASGSQ